MLAAAVATAFLVLLATRPAIAVLAYVGSRPLVDTYVHAAVGGRSAGEVWGAGLIVVCLAFLALTSTRGRRESFAVPGVFLGVFAALTVWRPQGTYVLSYGLKFAAWLLVVLVVERIARTGRGQRYAFATGFVSAVLGLLVIGVAILQNHYGNAYYATQFVDPTATFSDPGQQPVGLTEFAVMALPFVLFAGLVGIRRNLSSLVAAAIGVAVVASFVRTTQLGLAVVLLGFCALILRARHARGRVFLSFLPAAAGVLVAVYEVGTKLLLRFQDIGYLVSSGANKELAGSGRVFLWSKLIHSGLHSVGATLFGQGAGKSIALTINDGLNKSGVGGVWAHSDLVESFVTGGLVLVAAYVLLLLWMARPTWDLARDRRQSDAARMLGLLGLIALVSFNVMSLASGIAFSSVGTVPTAILLGLIRGVRTTPRASFVDRPAPWT